jgi:hypothetical protein
MKVKHFYTTDMRKKTQNPNTEIFKEAAKHLLANKLFCDYMTANERFNTEPERFFEEWMGRNIIRPDEDLKKWTWRYFLENLIAYRRNHKL